MEWVSPILRLTYYIIEESRPSDQKSTFILVGLYMWPLPELSSRTHQLTTSCLEA